MADAAPNEEAQDQIIDRDIRSLFRYFADLPLPEELLKCIDDLYAGGGAPPSQPGNAAQQ